MATTQENLDEYIKKLSSRLDDIKITTIGPDTCYSDDTVTLTAGAQGAPSTNYSISMGGTSHPSYGAVPNVVIGGGISWSQSAVGGVYNNHAMAVNQGGRVSLKGDNADIDINGKSLVQWMQGMEERMNWMQPNVDLEKEWDDLKKLGDRYRKLEQKCREKAEMWKKLKSMPKPEIG